MKEEEKVKLKKLIKELEKIKGRHTELVSVYIPSGYNLVEMINMLEAERSTAMNIKSKTTRKNVLAALEKILHYLRLLKKLPENGLVIFCGNVSPVEGRTDIRLWAIEPPEKLDTKIYWCDQVFVLNPLKEMIAEKEIYGLIVLDASEANIGLLKGKKIIHLKRIESFVPAKTIKGGMSQRRYDRIREDALNQFLTKVGEIASKLFLEQELKGVIIGGPGPVKEKFFDGDYLDYRIKKLVLGVKDIGYSDEYGLEELVKRSEDLLEKASVMKEKRLLNRFFEELGKGGNVVYGLENTLKALNFGAVETLLISEGLEVYKVKFKCQSGHEEEDWVKREDLEKVRKCKKCGREMEILEKVELIDEIEKLAKKFSTKIEIISRDTNEGKQFFSLGGIGAFLRFKV